MSPDFISTILRQVGQSAAFEDFHIKLDRLGTAIDAAATGGRITLVALDNYLATIDWAPNRMQLTVTHHQTPQNPEVTMKGVERYAFRVTWIR